MRKDELAVIKEQAMIEKHRKSLSKQLSVTYKGLKRVEVLAKYHDGNEKERQFRFETEYLVVECNKNALSCWFGGIDISDDVKKMVENDNRQFKSIRTCMGRLKSPTNTHYNCNNSIEFEINLIYE